MPKVPATTGENLNTDVLELVTASAGKPNRRWVHIFPEGTFTTRDGRGPFTVSNPEAVIAASLSAAGSTRIVVDYEHQSLNAAKNGQPNPAAGWIVEMERREGGIWALVEFTARATDHIISREYRYVSPVFLSRKDGTVHHIANVALTNTPALGGEKLVPLSKKEKAMDFDIARLRTLLGLDDQATESDIFDALERVLATRTERASVDLTKYAPVALLEKAVSEANSLRQGMAIDAATRHVETAIKDGKVPPYLKDWAIETCSVNVKVFEEFADRVAPTMHAILAPSGLTGSPPPAKSQPDETVLQVCRNLGITPENYEAASKKH